MERTTKVPDVVEDDKPKIKTDAVVITKPYWQKIGGGSFTMKGRNRYIKPGEKFYADEEEIPEAFRDTVIQIAPGSGNSIFTKINATVYKLTLREGVEEGSLEIYDVTDSNDKVINEKALTKEDAENLIKALSA